MDSTAQHSFLADDSQNLFNNNVFQNLDKDNVFNFNLTENESLGSSNYENESLGTREYRPNYWLL